MNCTEVSSGLSAVTAAGSTRGKAAGGQVQAMAGLEHAVDMD
jgi:hypothetical protein